MAEAVAGHTHTHQQHSVHHAGPDWFRRIGKFAGFGIIALGIAFVGVSLVGDLEAAPSAGVMAFILLGIALLIALGFEFVNGFHDTANAVATVIYTHSLPAYVAVVWSGFFNFVGVLVSSGAVAFGIASLLPVELILQVGSSAGFAMVFALLIAAIIWNIGTWYFGIPNSSSHALIGSIIGVGLMNQLLATSGSGTSGVDWSQAHGDRPFAAVFAWGGFSPFGATPVVAEGFLKSQAALYGAGRQRAAALVDSRSSHSDLYRRQLRARLE